MCWSLTHAFMAAFIIPLSRPTPSSRFCLFRSFPDGYVSYQTLYTAGYPSAGSWSIPPLSSWNVLTPISSVPGKSPVSFKSTLRFHSLTPENPCLRSCPPPQTLYSWCSPTWNFLCSASGITTCPGLKTTTVSLYGSCSSHGLSATRPPNTLSL